MGAGLPMGHFLRLVAEADVVVVELSECDQELSFALGMRHALGRCTVHVAEGAVTRPGAGEIPFVELPSHPADAVMARQQLTTVLTDALNGMAPVIPPTVSSAPRVEQAVHDEDAPGLLDLIAAAEAQLEGISGDMAALEAALADLGAMAELIGEDMARVSHPGASMSMKLAVVNRLGKAIDGPAGDLERAAERYAGRMKASVVAFGALLEWVGDMPRHEWPDGVAGILDDVIKVASDMRTAAVEFQEGMALINMFAASSRHLRGPLRRIGTAFQTIFGSVAVLEQWQDTAVALSRS
ncbi:hypothetical protein [Streptomyces hesseae]|uniref:Uncharacterized protein n=1 Tax=Streptomyces hesseae TaxID=3075519 RepID=A0ABU2SLR3_9ACTN|nr:hypothetical protein [Streptomyces sp. DSM 40473]MDT0449919.1 hypothetical protein [Streptomyces sp. DSM 40473]